MVPGGSGFLLKVLASFFNFQSSTPSVPRRQSSYPSTDCKPSGPGFACSFGNNHPNVVAPDPPFTVLGTAAQQPVAAGRNLAEGGRS